MSTQLATSETSLKDLISSSKMKSQFAAALPAHLGVDRFCRIAITAMTRSPKLFECTPASLMRCLLDLSAFGLEPDGRRAHLIPYGKECTLILDWKGLAELALRSGLIAKLHADIVCENDSFLYSLGEVTEHKINFKASRGAMYAAYAIAQTKDGQQFSAVMTKEEIDAIRKRSKAGNAGPWVSDYNEMAKKTAFRRLAKWLPLSAEFRDALDKDGDVIVERDVTPNKPAARLSPIDPFADIVPPEKAEAEPEPTDEESQFMDFIASLDDATDAEILADRREEAMTLLSDATAAKALKAVDVKAAALGLTWNQAKGGYEA